MFAREHLLQLHCIGQLRRHVLSSKDYEGGISFEEPVIFHTLFLDKVVLEEAFARLSEVLITSQIVERKPRDYTPESDFVFEEINTRIRSGDPTVLQAICDHALQLCKAESVGLSLCGFVNEEPVFNWHVTAGASANGGKQYSPRYGTPCGTVLELFSYQIFRHPEWHYPWAWENGFVIHEMISMPIYKDNHEPIGTFWLMHKEGSHFDHEDIRIISVLVAFIRRMYKSRVFQDLFVFS